MVRDGARSGEIGGAHLLGGLELPLEPLQLLALLREAQPQRRRLLPRLQRRDRLRLLLLPRALVALLLALERAAQPAVLLLQRRRLRLARGERARGLGARGGALIALVAEGLGSSKVEARLDRGLRRRAEA